MPARQRFDVKSDSPATRGWVEGRCAHLAVANCRSPAEAVRDADLVFSLVTADQALSAASAAAPHLAPGARYVDMAIMAPVHPDRHLTPALLAGPHAADAARWALAGLCMRPGLAGGEVGQASTIKMVRSVMVKGFDALTAECVLAARRAGVVDNGGARALPRTSRPHCPAATRRGRTDARRHPREKVREKAF